MPPLGIGLADRLSVLRNASRRSRLAALTEALRLCGPSEADAIARALLADPLPRDRALDALALAALRWPRLKDQTRSLWLAAAGDSVSALVDKLSRSASVEQRLAAAELVCHMPSATGIARLPLLLADKDEGVARSAEEAIRLAVDAASRDPSLLPVLDATLAEAATSYPEHRRRGVLEAMLPLLEAPPARLAQWLGDQTQPAILALRSVIRSDRSDGARVRALRVLSIPTLAPAAAARLSKRASVREHRVAFDHAHLLARESRRAEFARVRPERDALPTSREVAEMPEQARAGFVRMVCASGLDASKKSSLLAGTLVDPSPTVRAVAARELARTAPSDAEGAREAASLLADFAFSRDEAPSRIAVSALLNDRRLRRATPPETRAAMTRSRHECVRTAREILDRHEDPWTNPAAARVAMDLHRDAFVRELRRRVAKGDAPARVAALRIGKRLALARELELEVMAAATDIDPRVAATAAAALAEVRSASAVQALERLAEHRDERVRANAIEAIGEQRPLHPLVEVKLRAMFPRERANAARAALVAQPGHALAADALGAMLADADGRQRVSGLWAIERSRAVVMAPQIARVVREARDEHTLRRAKAAARMLLAVMQPSPGPDQSASPERSITPA